LNAARLRFSGRSELAREQPVALPASGKAVREQARAYEEHDFFTHSNAEQLQEQSVDKGAEAGRDGACASLIKIRPGTIPGQRKRRPKAPFPFGVSDYWAGISPDACMRAISCA
jgi:hypothetical protein